MTSTAIEVSAPATITPMDLIQRASAQDVSIERMQQLFDLQLRWEADQARKAFNAAMATFKRNPPRITKNVTKKAGTMELNYASIDHVCDVLIPALAAVGIRHSWSMKQEGSQMIVTCTLTHDLGHSESASLSSPYDTSGGKNAIQAIASAQTYLQRYTLLAVTGQAAGGVDDDAVSAGEVALERMSEAEFIARRDAITACQTFDELKTTYKAAQEAALKLKDNDTAKAFEQVKNAQFRAIQRITA